LRFLAPDFRNVTIIALQYRNFYTMRFQPCNPIQTAPLWRAKGFTLSELLVSVSVLGLIASLAIPSIIVSLERSHKKALFKETFNVLSNGIRSGTDLNTLLELNDMNFYRTNLNTQKTCTNAQTEGCWTGSNAPGNVSSAGGITLQTGASITSFRNATTGVDRVFIDINGSNAPNTLCEDQFPVVVSLREGVAFEGVNLRMGEVKYSAIENGFSTANSCQATSFPS
jgi:prepilin-type N-terminal cleavage/methylation domain-containing protein